MKSLLSGLSVDDRERVYEEGLQLQEDQNKMQTSDCLPSLSVADVDKTTPTTELIHEDHGKWVLFNAFDHVTGHVTFITYMCINCCVICCYVMLVKYSGFFTFILGCIPIQFSVQPTNGISYLQFLSSCRELPQDLQPYLPLFCSVITK